MKYFLLLCAMTLVHTKNQLEELSVKVINKHLFLGINMYIDFEISNFFSINQQLEELEMEKEKLALSNYYYRTRMNLSSVSKSYEEMIKTIYQTCDYNKAVYDQLVKLSKLDINSEELIKDKVGLLKTAVDQTVNKTTTAQDHINQIKNKVTNLDGILVPFRKLLQLLAPKKREQLDNQISETQKFIELNCLSAFGCMYSNGQNYKYLTKLKNMRERTEKLEQDSIRYSDWLIQTSAEFNKLASVDEEIISSLKETAQAKSLLLNFSSDRLDEQSKKHVTAYSKDINKAVKEIYDKCLEFVKRGPQFFFHNMKPRL